MKVLSKYLFGTLVFVYVLTAVGMPIYLHYCGGEVEEVSYLIETNGCCEDEIPDDGCCRNEGVVLLNDADFTIKSFDTHVELPETVLSFLCNQTVCRHSSEGFYTGRDNAPVPWQHSLLAEITVLRI